MKAFVKNVVNESCEINLGLYSFEGLMKLLKESSSWLLIIFPFIQ